MTIDSDVAEILSFLKDLRAKRTKIVCQPLGFYRIFLTARDALSEGLLLHVWADPNQYRKSKEIDIHHHTFDMRSRILAGRLVNKLYDVQPSEQGRYKLVNVYHDGKNATRVVTDISVEPTIIKVEEVSPGQIYSFGSKIFHSTEIVSYPTITLMQKTNMISDNAVNIIRDGYSPDEVGIYKQPVIDEEAIWSVVFESLNI